MGILLSALAAAGDAGVQSENQNIQQLNQQALQQSASDLASQRDEQSSALQQQKELTILAAQKQAAIDSANQQRQDMADRISAAQQPIIQSQLANQFAPSDSAVAAAANGQTDAPLTQDQLGTISQAKTSAAQQISADPHTYIAAASQTGDITPGTIAQLAIQEDANKRIEAQNQSNQDHADAMQDRQFKQQMAMQSKQIAAQREMMQSRLDANKSDPAVIQKTAQMVADGDMTIGLRDPDRTEIISAAKQINPNYNEGDYKASYQAKQAFATGKQGEQVRFNNNALDHLNTLKAMATALNNKDVPAYNAAANALAKQMGDSTVTNFDVARNLVGQEVVKAIVPGAGGEKEREAAADAFSRSGSPGQILGAASTYGTLLSTQIHGLQQQYNASNPVYVNDPSKSDFARYLTAGTRAVTGIRPPPGKDPSWALADQGPASIAPGSASSAPNPYAAAPTTALPDGWSVKVH